MASSRGPKSRICIKAKDLHPRDMQRNFVHGICEYYIVYWQVELHASLISICRNAISINFSQGIHFSSQKHILIQITQKKFYGIDVHTWRLKMLCYTFRPVLAKQDR